MAWEWVSPVATASAGVVAGGIGVYFTWLTGKGGREHAEAIARDQLSHERLLAEEARKQQRLESAYVSLLGMAERSGQWAQMAFPIVGTTPREVALPSLVEQANTRALVRAFGSAEVLKRLETWITVVQQMTNTAELIEQEDMGRQVVQEGERAPRARFALDLRPQERETREAIANQVAVELGHRTDPEPDQSPPEAMEEV